MAGVLSQRLFPILQLTRMALVFTAVSDAGCGLLLLARQRAGTGGGAVWRHLQPVEVAAVVMVSAGLYGFGMSLNDIIDRRRDRQLAAHRPLPSGRVGVFTAHLICGLLLAVAVAGSALYAAGPGGTLASVALVVWTAAIITFYDVAGKYLVGLGLLSLGVIRFFHALVPAPSVPLVWHPLLLLNHVTVLSLVAYRWEQKRPPLTPLHRWTVLGGLAGVDAVVLATVYLRRHGAGQSFAAVMNVTPGLLPPLAAAGAFAVLAAMVRRARPNPREAGQAVMLYGLLWLIVYDAAFAAGYVGWVEAGVLALLLPAAYASVRVMRWWGGVVALSHRPAFKRAVE